MKDAILIELAAIWEFEAKMPEAIDDSDNAKEVNAKAQGHRECKRECADVLRILVSILGT